MGLADWCCSDAAPHDLDTDTILPLPLLPVPLVLSPAPRPPGPAPCSPSWSSPLQALDLRKGCDLLIATPGRLIDLMGSSVNLMRLKYMVSVTIIPV
jgi:hypothetical protein